MNPNLRNMLVGVGVFAVAVGGAVVRLNVFTPQPATRSMLELRDAGILDGQRLAIKCPERLTKQTKRRIEAKQPGLLRPGQSYATILRTARCFNPDGGNCFRPSDGLPRIADLEGGLIIPSLRRDLAGVDLDASVGLDDGGDSDDVDDSLQYDVTGCAILTCPQVDDMVDAGTLSNPFANAFCGNLNRLMVVPSPCMIPNGWNRGADGGWCEETACLDPAGPGGYRACEPGDTCGEVDCKFTGPYGLSDGGARWRGFNVGPREYAVGTACVPVECGVVAGDVPAQWL